MLIILAFSFGAVYGWALYGYDELMKIFDDNTNSVRQVSGAGFLLYALFLNFALWPITVLILYPTREASYHARPMVNSGHDRFALNKLMTGMILTAAFLLYNYVKKTAKKSKTESKK